MTRSTLVPILVPAVVVGVCALRPASAEPQDVSQIAGRWTLNRELSQFPREIGFGADWLSAAGTGQSTNTGGGRGRRGSGGGSAPGGFSSRRESEDDAKRLQQLTAEVRGPSEHLLIVETPAAVTISDDRGQTRTFHPDGKEEVLQLDGVPVGAIAKREAGRLTILYKVEEGREIRYTYFSTANPPQLTVDVALIEHGGGDKVRRIYAPSTATETPASATGVRSTAAASKPADVSAVGGLQARTFNQQPDAELKGLTNLGIVVEDFTPQAAACGLNQGTIEAALSKRLSDAGLKVRRNSDEDTYVYVNVITTSVPGGLCVSRYDAFLYTHTTATLSYQQTPVLVQVSLLHKGGIAGGTSAAHADGVLRGLQEYVDQFSARIRDANK